MKRKQHFSFYKTCFDIRMASSVANVPRLYNWIFTVHHKGRTSAIEDDMTDIAMSKHVLRNDKCCFLFKHWPFNCNNWRRYKIRPSQLGQHESVKLAWFIFAPLSMLSIMFLLSRKNKLCTSLKSGHQTRWANSASYFTEVW